MNVEEVGSAYVMIDGDRIPIIHHVNDNEGWFFHIPLENRAEILLCIPHPGFEKELGEASMLLLLHATDDPDRNLDFTARAEDGKIVYAKVEGDTETERLMSMLWGKGQQSSFYPNSTQEIKQKMAEWGSLPIVV